MKKVALLILITLINVFAFSRVALADNTITTGDSSSDTTVINEVNHTTVDCNCTTPAPTNPPATGTPGTPPSNPGDGKSDGKSSGPAQVASPVKAVLGLSNTTSGDTTAKELALLLSAVALVTLGVKSFKNNAR